MDFFAMDAAAPLATRTLHAAALLLAALLPPALLVNQTPKGSVLRALWLPALVFTSARYLTAASALTPITAFNQCLVGGFFPVAWQCVDALVVQPRDARDLDGVVHRRGAGLPARLVATVFFLFLNLRGIGTPWATKAPPPWPRFYGLGGKASASAAKGPSRGVFVARQLLIIAWQYLFLEVVEAAARAESPAEKARKSGPGTEWIWFGGTREQIAARIIMGLTWTIPGRVTVDLTYRLACMAMVIPGFQEPRDWPPVFGPISESYTLRGFWSDYWHQLMRLPLTTVSNWIARDVLRLARPSFFERYFNIFLTFLQSGIIHSLQAIHGGTPMRESGSVFFFLSFVVGIMAEDAVQALWRRGAPRPKKGAQQRPPPLWQRLLGFAWVNAWMVLTVPWLIYPITRMDPEGLGSVPPTVINAVGMKGALGLLAGGGVVLKFALGGEL